MHRHALVAAALAAIALPARASMVEPLDLAALVDRSDRVVVGRVESQASRWTGDKSAIYTDVVVRVTRSMKGGVRAGDAITVRREGGEADGTGMLVQGAARFTVGEEVVLFLERRGAATWTVGMAQGKLRVVERDGRKVALRSTAGLSFLRPPAPEPGARPLDELLQAVAELVRRGSPR